MAGSGPVIDISMLGNKELSRQFDQLEPKVQKRLFRKGVRDAMRPVLKTAKELVPADTGDLRRSLKLRAGKRKRNVIRMTVMTGTREKLKLPDKGGGYYPMSVEAGYFDKRLRRHVAARPYMRPALHKNKQLMLAILGKHVRAAIASSTRRAA